MDLILVGLILLATAIALLRIHDLPPFAVSLAEDVPANHKESGNMDSPGDTSQTNADSPAVPCEVPASAEPASVAAHTTAPAGIADAPPYPPDDVVVMPEGLPAGWLTLKGSAKGHQKEVLQDAHALRVIGDCAILVVADGAGSKPRSKAGADHAVAQVIGILEARIETLEHQRWPEVASAIFLEVAGSLGALADAEGNSVGDYSSTLIVLVATGSHVLCAHVGDGRAGYLGEDGILRAAMTPYKGQEANSTVFLGMLQASNVQDYLRTRVIPCRARAVMALSDGPENVCWHTATLDPEGSRLVDPNKPAASFFGKIVMQLASAAAANVPSDDLDAKWSQFLETGNSMLAEERDDKTLLFAMRG